MTTTTDIIKEFLVALGYRVDQQSQKDFEKKIDDAEKAVKKLGVVVTGVAAAVEIAMAKISDSATKLYFMQQRTNATAEGIKAFEYAAQQLGDTADNARSSLEGLGSFMRNTPGSEDFLKGIGVQTRDVNGELLKTERLAQQLGPIFAKMEPYRAKAFANVLGIDERTMLAMRDGTFNRRAAEYEKILANIGLDYEHANEANKNYNIELQRFYAHLDAVTLLWETRLLPVATKFLTFLERAGVWLGHVSSWLDRMDKKTGGLVSIVGEFVGLMVLLAGVAIIAAAAIGAITKALLLLSAAFLLDPIVLGIMALAAGAILIVKHWDQLKAWFVSFFAWFEKKWDWVIKAYDKFAKMMGWRRDDGSTDGPSPNQTIRVNTAAITPGDATSQRMQSGAAKAAMDFFEKAGWTSAQAAGIVANLMRESHLNPRAVGDGGRAFGLAQWHPDRQAEFQRLYGKPITQATFQEQLAFVQHELTRGNERAAGQHLKASETNREAASMIAAFYERPQNIMGEAIIRGSMADQLASSRGNVTLNQRTEIKVADAGTNPEAVARAIASRQQTVNSDLVRNVEGNLR